MATIMSKRGNSDNIAIYEHYCDTKQDLDTIPLEYTTLGSVAIVVHGTNDTLEVYIADSNKQWCQITGGQEGD